MFKDRREAGGLLAKKLEIYKGTDAIVLALPRGGVVLGYEIAKELNLPLDVIVTRKIGHPQNPEYAIGAVDEHGTFILNESEARTVSQGWLKDEIKKEMKEARRRSIMYRRGKSPLMLSGKIAIIVDDGIATGFTMRLAAKVASAQSAGKIVVAVPVAPPESIQELTREGVSEVAVLEDPEEFLGAVGSHYQEFPQVSDEEVIKLLNRD